MGIIDWLYPRKCVGCGRTGKYFCQGCWGEMRLRLDWICPECSRGSFGGEVHRGCRKKYGLDGLVSLLSYQGLVRAGVHRLKYGLIKDLEQELETILLDRIKERTRSERGGGLREFLSKKPKIVPVPLYWRRKNWRGFNQAEIIARIVAEGLGLRLLMGLVERRRATKPQVKLSRDERKSNVEQAFRVKKGMVVPERILLIDDVWTTGETMRVVGQELKRAGARVVWGLSLAR